MSTQRDRVIKMLEDSGSTGVHSFEFYAAHMPRAAATIHALKKKDGVDIVSTPEPAPSGSPGCRYRLARFPAPPRRPAHRAQPAPPRPAAPAPQPAPAVAPSLFGPAWADTSNPYADAA